MSLIQDLGAQVRAASDELPTGLVTVAMERLRGATELLMWVRETSQDPMGVPQLGNALEAAERAAAAIRVTQDSLATYLAGLGLAADAAAPPDRDWKAGLEPPAVKADAGEAPPPGEKLGPWWQQRVAQLTGEPAPPEDKHKAASTEDTAELLRRVASGVRAGDKAKVGRDLHGASAATGLALSAMTSPVLHRLAGDLLGHEPRPDDVDRLRTASAGRVRSLLPGTSPAVLDTLLARICRAPVEKSPGQPATHPADSAVTASVLTGVLLARLGRDAATLKPDAPDPVRRAEAADAR
jgi:hypothetical protein